MSQLAPPKSPPRLTFDEGDHIRRLRFRLWQVLTATLTVLLTAWACTFGWIAAIVALMVAKHVLVAILVMGMGVDRGTRPGR
ncbi:MAG TPA: hypothetical protein VKE94_10735 [Gemmataceae bacterium]|nr:hypothetical protein [Gemmataceae bacterium]